MNIKRRRIKAYVDALSELILSENPTRDLAIELIRRRLEGDGLEPFRGASKPEDIYEKELISMYIVATRGLGIKPDYPHIFEKVFTKEMMYETILNLLNSNLPKEKIRNAVSSILKEMNGSDIARILRFAVTLYYLDFENYEYVINTIKKFYEIFPEFEDTIRRFTKFFVAVKLSEEIASGAIKNKIDKEVRKQLISIETGIPKSTPPDEYVAKIARIVYEVPKKVINNVLGSRDKEPSSSG